MEENISADVAKEFMMVISYCDNEFLENIPSHILRKLNDLAADSNKEVLINKNKSLVDQDVSLDCKSLLGLLYFMYMTDANEKQEIINLWLKNEKDSVIN